MPATRTRRQAQPVSLSQLPVVRCALCGQTMAHQPRKGAAAAVLTEHYNRDYQGDVSPSTR